MTKPLRTFQDLDDRLPELGYTKRTRAQIRPEIRRSEKIYNAPLARIPVDLADFENRWGAGRIAAVAEGFDSHAQFVNWRKRVRAALGRASGTTAARSTTVLPEWQAILTYVEVNGGIGRLLPPHLELSIGAVARAASSSSLTPLDLGDVTIKRISDALKGPGFRSFRLGIDRINYLIDRRCDLLPEIDALLPETPLSQPPERQAPSSPLRRNGGAQNAKLLWREFDLFVQEKRGVDALGRPVPPEKSKFGATTEKRYAGALQQALNTLVRFGRLSADAMPSLRDICNAETIEETARFWNVRQIDGEVKMRGTMLYTLVCRLSHIAQTCGAKKKERKRLKELRKRLKEASGEVGTMMPERVQWVKDFAANPALQRAVLGMPETLMREANRILKDWDKHKGKRNQKLRMDALKMGTSACMAAILFRAAPVRAANLRNIKFQGDAANLVDDGGGLRVIVPGEEVKNRRAIDQTADDDAWPVIEWYLKHIRPKLIDDHPYMQKKVRLVDSDYLFPSTKADCPLEETTLADHYARGCELAGLAMTFHLARHITVFLILDADPNAWAAAAAVLDDDIVTVREHYAWMDTKKASAEGRALVKQSREAVRKHKKGSYRAA